MYMALHNDELASVEIAVWLTHIRSIFAYNAANVLSAIEVSREKRVEIKS